MKGAELNKFIDAWIRYQKHLGPKDIDHPDWWAVDGLLEMTWYKPETAWIVIRAILDRDQSDEIVQILSAGALEDLLAQHGEDFIDRIEFEAQNNPDFAFLLGGVWQNEMSDELYARVQSVWDRRGWEGN